MQQARSKRSALPVFASELYMGLVSLREAELNRAKGLRSGEEAVQIVISRFLILNDSS